MSDNLTYKITIAILFIVTAYKRNSHHKVYLQFYKRNADCLKVKNTALPAKKLVVASGCAIMNKLQKTRPCSPSSEHHLSTNCTAAAGSSSVAGPTELKLRKKKAGRASNKCWNPIIANGG